MTTSPQLKITDPLLLYFIHTGLIAETAAEKIILSCQQQAISLLKFLYQQPQLPPAQIAQALAKYLGLDFFDLSAINSKTLAKNLLEVTLIREHQVLPLSITQRQLTLAISEPAQLGLMNDIKFHTGLDVLPIVVEMPKLQRFIVDYCSALRYHSLHSNQEFPVANQNDDLRISQFVEQMLIDAIQKHASDIHLEPYKPGYRLRFRIDGILHSITELSLDFANRCLARIKVMAKLDIAERRQPQDGRFSLIINTSENRDFRISTCPTLLGEKIVARILDANPAVLDLEQLGLDTQQKHQLINLIEKPQGLILVTGPTGSGKTITLYTILQKLNSAEKNIATVEDPVEIELAGINQVQINLKIELTFAKALRALLRQDPDIIMIGEIRDQETADIAIKAAQTGHLVLATLHTNSAAETLTRLLMMGISSFNLIQALQLIIAQRLLRKLCPHCKQAYNSAEFLHNHPELATTLAEPPSAIFSASACEMCTQGYSGRTGVFEFLVMTPTIMNMILAGKLAADIAAENTRAGWRNLRENALHKVAMGESSWQELQRVIF